MSGYENVIAGKLRLKGKPLDLRDNDTKKKNKHRKHHDQLIHAFGHDQLTVGKVQICSS